jgi:hypothetical protein
MGQSLGNLHIDDSSGDFVFKMAFNTRTPQNDATKMHCLQAKSDGAPHQLNSQGETKTLHWVDCDVAAPTGYERPEFQAFTTISGLEPQVTNADYRKDPRFVTFKTTISGDTKYLVYDTS